MLAVLLALAVLAVIACSSDDEGPQDIQFDLAIRDGDLDLEDDTIRVRQGDAVTFRMTADQAGGIHLHGYNLEADVGPDAPVEMKFEADATGRFVITLHTFAAEHDDSTDGDEGEHKDDEGEHENSEHQKEKAEAEHQEEEEEITLATLEVRPR